MTAAHDTEPVRITVVDAPGCHFCEDAHEALAAMVRAGHRLEVRTIGVGSSEGRALVQRHRAALSPLVLVDGAFFSHGRLPKGKLLQLLESRPSAPAHATTAEA
ncbi:hypothetical protein [Angustibacter sp. Root456]|uniref:hypothetical protein n=1 Tax=Angustibacter sp. Root456 TaxID=1736539 RepID=UPI0006F93260|nr:hypothetical protein [Angustibacter sp. Root456]KQX64506.1 hypothetical protein ASD06_10125 [Angustibacter sp. Root456]